MGKQDHDKDGYVGGCMKGFNSTVALVFLVISLLFLQGDLLLSLTVSAVAGLIYALLFGNKIVIAFDAGGVITEGDYFTEEIKMRAGMKELVKKLKENYRVVLLTNQNALAQKLFSKKFGFGSLFDDQIVSGEVGMKKPDTNLFAYVSKKFGVKPNNIIFVDDKLENVESAKQAGLNAIQFTSLEGLVAELRNLKIAL